LEDRQNCWKSGGGKRRPDEGPSLGNRWQKPAGDFSAILRESNGLERMDNDLPAIFGKAGVSPFFSEVKMAGRLHIDS